MKEQIEKQLHDFVEEICRISYMDGMKDASLSKGELFKREVNKAYRRGLNDAWECARKICTNWCLSDKTLAEIFGNGKTIDDIMREYSASEAIAKIKEYEKKQTDEIKVGDEVYSETSNTKAVVTRVTSWGEYECINSCGAQFVLEKETWNRYWKKTSRHFSQIAEVLKELGGE